MALDLTAILDAVMSHALATGEFTSVNGHEPQAAPVPAGGPVVAVWVDRVEPVKSSGLDSTSARVVLNVRLFASPNSQPQDAIDPNMVRALDTLLTAYGNDLDLGGSVRCVDLFGSDGAGLSAQAGYLTYDKASFRVITVSLPLIVNDVWDQD